MEFYSKEVSILRQSQSKMAMDYINHIGIKVTFTELQRVTDVFVECCLRPQDNDLKERIKNLDNWFKTKIKENGKE